MKLKTDVSFMKMVDSDEAWQRDVIEAGDKLLCIVDVYTGTWGPCEMMSQHFGNYFFDMGDALGSVCRLACDASRNRCRRAFARVRRQPPPVYSPSDRFPCVPSQCASCVPSRILSLA